MPVGLLCEVAKVERDSTHTLSLSLSLQNAKFIVKLGLLVKD